MSKIDYNLIAKLTQIPRNDRVKMAPYCFISTLKQYRGNKF